MNSKKSCLFIDRDGVINHLIKYGDKYDSPQRPEDVKLKEAVVQLLKWTNESCILVVEISNQPGVAKGKQTLDECWAIDRKVHDLLAANKVWIDKTYMCLHHPSGVVSEYTKVCGCRKPKPGLLLQAVKDLNIDLNRSIFLGDKATDMEAGIAAGCKTIIYLHQEDVPEKVKAAYLAQADYKVTDLNQALGVIQDYFQECLN